MQLEHYPAEKFQQEVRNIVEKHLNSDEFDVFFFGSRVSGTSDERSDIDIGIKGEKPVPADKFFRIKEELEQLPVLYKIELVDFYYVSTDFSQLAEKNKEMIYD